MDKIILYSNKDVADKWAKNFIEKYNQYIWIAEDDGKCIHIALTNYDTIDLVPYDYSSRGNRAKEYTIII